MASIKKMLKVSRGLNKGEHIYTQQKIMGVREALEEVQKELRPDVFRISSWQALWNQEPTTRLSLYSMVKRIYEQVASKNVDPAKAPSILTTIQNTEITVKAINSLLRNRGIALADFREELDSIMASLRAMVPEVQGSTNAMAKCRTGIEELKAKLNAHTSLLRARLEAIERELDPEERAIDGLPANVKTYLVDTYLMVQALENARQAQNSEAGKLAEPATKEQVVGAQLALRKAIDTPAWLDEDRKDALTTIYLIHTQLVNVQTTQNTLEARIKGTAEDAATGAYQRQRTILDKLDGLNGLGILEGVRKATDMLESYQSQQSEQFRIASLRTDEMRKDIDDLVRMVTEIHQSHAGQ